jgi:endonuclease-3
MLKKERYAAVLDWFRRNCPDAQTELIYHNPFELLVAVILSAQCTDKRVNMVTPELFRAFPTPQKMSETTEDELYEYIKSISYPHNKAGHLLRMSQRLVAEYGGEVPDDFDALLSLPGVGRKTANVIASVVFNRPAMAVDTHVFRVCNRIGLTTNSRTPLATEQELLRNIPTEDVATAHHWLILHGRYVCTARAPHCDACGIAAFCRHHEQQK